MKDVLAFIGGLTVLYWFLRFTSWVDDITIMHPNIPGFVINIGAYLGLFLLVMTPIWIYEYINRPGKINPDEDIWEDKIL